MRSEFWTNKRLRDGKISECRSCSNARALANYRQRRSADPKRVWAQLVVTSARRRARQRGLDFDLTVDEIIATLPDFCPALGMRLDYRGGRGPGARENSPSLDRRDNSKGYTATNVVVISYRANSMKRDATVDEIVRLAAFLQQSAPFP